jgi:cation diffusion facilitator family transporter
VTGRFEFPPEQGALRLRARRLAWMSILVIGFAGVLLFLTTGRSQTMKTAWATDLLSLVPSIALIVAMRFELRPPNRHFPFGHFRAVSICFLATASALLTMGLVLFSDAVLKLVRGERPPIGTMEVFGQQFWMGWAMIAALTFSMVAAIVLGRAKVPVAQRLHSKAVQGESEMNSNEWMSEGAGILGILLVGFGWWWADAAAAAVISLEVIHGGWNNLRQVIGDLMDEAPSKLGTHELESLPEQVKTAAERLDWVSQAAVRLREHGHVVTGEVFVVPRDGVDVVARVAKAAADLRAVDWRLHSLTVMPVPTLAEAPIGDIQARPG